MPVKVNCDVCKAEIDYNEEVFCGECYKLLLEEKSALEDELQELQKENKALEQELIDLEDKYEL